jgi:CDP-diacylglycerol--glycerol-3-phosphate 3-phosphatidyltransferase
MITLPSLISLVRVPLAFLFLYPHDTYRLIILLLAMVSDVLDGFLARRYGWTSPLGTLLDPLADKFFVLVILCTFLVEEKLTFYEAMAMMSRDFAILLFCLYLSAKGCLKSYPVHAIWCGKVTTSLQFLMLIGLTIGIAIPSQASSLFILLGIGAFIELYKPSAKQPMQDKQ